MTQSTDLGAVAGGQSGLLVRTAFNTGLQALATDSEGPSPPSPSYPFMLWRNDAARLLWRRDAANSAWTIERNYGATRDPGGDDDAAHGYVAGSHWINVAAGRLWSCADASTGAARWFELRAVGTATGNLVEVLAGGKLPALSGENLTGIGSFTAIRTFASPGSVTWTRPAGLRLVVAFVWGAGGGGAAVGTYGNGAGGAGGFALKRIDAAALGATETVTVGAGGAGATTAGANGGAGGTSSFGAIMSATGGGGGSYLAGGTGNSGLGGVGSGGDLNIAGQPGYLTWAYGNVMQIGGSAPWGGAGGVFRIWTGSAISGGDGVQPGGGGACAEGAAPTYRGGNGAHGMVMLWEFS